MRKLIATLATLAAIAFTGANAAHAGSSSVGNIIISPGSRVCVPAQYAFDRVRVDGQAASPGLLFTVQRSADGANFTQIGSSYSSATAFGAEYYRSWQPSYFPGYFKACARNQSTQGVLLYNMSVRTDASF